MSRPQSVMYTAHCEFPTGWLITMEVVCDGVHPWRYTPPGRVRSSARAEIGISDSDVLVLYAGRISPEKGIETLLDAFERTLGSAPRVHLRLVSCETVPQNQSYARALKARRGPWMWGPPQTDMQPLFGVADLVVVPSAGQEAFGGVALEAIACGCPVVAARTCGIPELLTGRLEQLLVQPGDPAVLAAKLGWAMRWREHLPDLGRGCREHVASSFTLERTRAGVEDVLQAAIEEQERYRSGQYHARLLGWRRRALSLNSDTQRPAVK